MDRFELAIVDYDEENYIPHICEVVEYYINGTELLDIIETALGADNFNKYKYVGIRPEYACLPSTYLLGPPQNTPHDRTLLYVCGGCGLAACESIEAQVVLDDETVIWHNFTTRLVCEEEDLEGIEYLSVPEFKFNRADYENALRYHKERKIEGYVKKYYGDIKDKAEVQAKKKLDDEIGRR